MRGGGGVVGNIQFAKLFLVINYAGFFSGLFQCLRCNLPERQVFLGQNFEPKLLTPLVVENFCVTVSKILSK